MSITSANAVIMLSLQPLFITPYQLQQFAADNIYGTDAIEASETAMGVDGILTGGFVNVAVRQTFYLQADSPSNYFFQQWYEQQRAQQDTFTANGTLILRSLGAKFKMTKGFLKSYQPISDGGRVLKERRHTIEWNVVSSNPS